MQVMWLLLTVITKDSAWRQTKRLVWLRVPSEQQSLMLGLMLPLAVSLKHRLLRQLGQGGKLIVACRVRRLPSICSSDLFTWLNRTTTQLAMHDECMPLFTSFDWGSIIYSVVLLGIHENRASTSSSFFRYDIYFLDMLETTNRSRFGLAETFLHDGYALYTIKRSPFSKIKNRQLFSEFSVLQVAQYDSTGS